MNLFKEVGIVFAKVTVVIVVSPLIITGLLIAAVIQGMRGDK